MVKAKLLIDTKEVNVLWYKVGFNQTTDRTGRPSQQPIFKGLQVVIESQKDIDLADWSFAADQTKQLELHIYPVLMGGKTRKIYFYDCHLVDWKTHFSASGSKKPMSESLQISAGGLKDSNSMVEYSNYWRETYQN
ncbi:hypothetical protein GCM10009117_02610 [Gangjinia marincola]|uniref:Uncharacterized protein n=1 Tax=Gangjinia marincola TaxID=578463 RepID=A0ABN1MDH6_9FLAO